MLVRETQSPEMWVEALDTKISSKAGSTYFGFSQKVYRLSLFKLIQELFDKIYQFSGKWTKTNIVNGFRCAIDDIIDRAEDNVIFIEDLMPFLQIPTLRPFTLPLLYKAGHARNIRKDSSDDVYSCGMSQAITERILDQTKRYIYQQLADHRSRFIAHATRKETQMGMLLYGPSGSLGHLFGSKNQEVKPSPKWKIVPCHFKYDIEGPMPTDIMLSVLKMKILELKSHKDLKPFKIKINKDIITASTKLIPYMVNGSTFTGMFPNLRSGTNPDNALLWIQHILCALAISAKTNGGADLTELCNGKKIYQLVLNKPLHLYQLVCRLIVPNEVAQQSLDSCAVQTKYHLQNVLKGRLIIHEESIEQIAEFHEWDQTIIHKQCYFLNSEEQGISSYVFVGPFHTGKLVLAKLWSKYILGNECECIEIDMQLYKSLENWDSFCDLVGYQFDVKSWSADRPYKSINNKKLVVLKNITRCSLEVLKRIYKMLNYGEIETSSGYCRPIKGAAYALIVDLFNFEISDIKEEYMNENSMANNVDIISSYFSDSANLFDMRLLVEKYLAEKYALPGHLQSRTIIFDELDEFDLKKSIKIYIGEAMGGCSDEDINMENDHMFSEAAELYTSGAFGRTQLMDKLEQLMQNYTTGWNHQDRTSQGNFLID
ncbi:hypothetical protein H4219_003476 [Mycoemilia scoparia]|uniref:Uncharacterized protein n=1 Tax=Mycoemilia scoparia TaxID=417184 RepID=A0A9W8DTA6_9FUNG|nr:hypothetical protein H4219_003476 [Mycoemilia scoparia]